MICDCVSLLYVLLSVRVLILVVISMVKLAMVLGTVPKPLPRFSCGWWGSQAHVGMDLGVKHFFGLLFLESILQVFCESIRYRDIFYFSDGISALRKMRNEKYLKAVVFEISFSKVFTKTDFVNSICMR